MHQYGIFSSSSQAGKKPNVPVIGTAYAGYYNTGIVTFTAGAPSTTPPTSYTITSSGSQTATVSTSVGRTNLVPNPSFEGNINGWTSVGNAGAYSTNFSKVGLGSCLLSYNGSATVGIQYTFGNGIPVNSGTAITFSFYAYRSSDVGQITFNHIFLDSGLNQISDYTHANISTSQSTVGWFRVSQTVIVPFGAAWTQPRIYITPSEGGGSTAFNAYIDAVLIESGANLQDYFDGTNTILTPGRYSGTPTIGWTGTANASTSIFTGVNDLTGPYSGTVTGLTSGTNYNFTVHANNANGSSVESGASNIITTTTRSPSTFQYNALPSSYVPGDIIQFPYTGTVQTFLGLNSNSVKLEVWGASGYQYTTAGGTTAGLGGYSYGNYTNSGANLYVYCGGQGINAGQNRTYSSGAATVAANAAGFNGGGASSYGISGSVVHYGTGGSGGSDIRTSPSGIAYTNRLLVGGGGGGSGFPNVASFNCSGGYGGGGNAAGGNGQGTQGGYGTGASTSYAGTNTGANNCSGGTPGTNGSGAVGGTGGGDNMSYTGVGADYDYCAAGGGGGYFGGGGASGGGICGQGIPGAGGGSGYIGGVSSGGGTSGIWSGAGKAQITILS
jgi:hypothetical protein